METIAGKLKKELTERGWSYRHFQKQVKGEDAGVRGANYASVHDYMEKGVTPSLSFLRVAARVLGVRVAWLALGDGPRTEIEALAGTGEGEENRLTELVLGRVPHLYVHRPAVRAAYIETLRRIMQTHPNGGGDLADADIEKMASQIWVMIGKVQMRIATMVGRRESIFDSDIFGLAMLQAMMAAIGRAPAPSESALAPQED